MLHAWELGMLSEEDRERFEIHLLECDACAEEAQTFLQAGRLLRSDPDFRPSVDELSATAKSDMRKANVVRRRLTRALLAAAAIVVVAIPAYRWIIAPSPESTKVQRLNLVPIRNGSNNTVTRDPDGTLEVRFYAEGAVAGNPYRVSVKSESGRTVFATDDYTGFSKQGAGLLVFKMRDLDAGLYTLTVSPASDSLAVIQQYNFRID